MAPPRAAAAAAAKKLSAVVVASALSSDDDDADEAMRAPAAGARKRRVRIDDDDEDDDGADGAAGGGSGSETDEPPPRATSGVHKAAKRGPGRPPKGEGKAAPKVRRFAPRGAQCASQRGARVDVLLHRFARAGGVRCRYRCHARDRRAGSRAGRPPAARVLGG
jgi:hypothetical protein